MNHSSQKLTLNMELEQAVLSLRNSHLEAEISVNQSDLVLDCSFGQQWLGECLDPCNFHHATELGMSINQREKADSLISQTSA